jgi:hypothetical protein
MYRYRRKWESFGVGLLVRRSSVLKRFYKTVGQSISMDRWKRAQS